MGQGVAHDDALHALRDQSELWAGAGGCAYGSCMGGVPRVGHGGTGGCAAGVGVGGSGGGGDRGVGSAAHGSTVHDAQAEGPLRAQGDGREGVLGEGPRVGGSGEGASLSCSQTKNPGERRS